MCIAYMYVHKFFHELLQKDHSFIILHRSTQSLGIELYKVKEISLMR